MTAAGEGEVAEKDVLSLIGVSVEKGRVPWWECGLQGLVRSREWRVETVDGDGR